MCRWIVLTLFVSAALGAGAAHAQQKNFTAAARSKAPELAKEIMTKAGKKPFTVAVFTPGDADGVVTLSVAEPSKVFQGELIYALQQELNDKGFKNVTVLTRAGLKEKFDNAAAVVKPTDIKLSDAKVTATALTALKVDAGVVGTFEAKSFTQVTVDKLDKINCNFALIFQTGVSFNVQETVTTAPPPPMPKNPKDKVEATNLPEPTIPQVTTRPSGRFAVEIFLEGETEPLPLETSKRLDSEFHKVYFLILPERVKKAVEAGELKGSQFRIRISNLGGPNVPVSAKPGANPVQLAVGIENDKDRERLFAAAVLVDGVNSFYEPDGSGKVGPVVRHPSNVSRWILSGPGLKLKPDPSDKKGKGFTFEQVSDSRGHSIIDIPGFQKDLKFADAFVFAKADKSVAATTVGLTNDVGMIAVHFYPEKMNGDTVALDVVKEKAGVRAGPQVEMPVFAVNPEFYPNPCEVWRIFYRFESPIPVDERTPVIFSKTPSP